MAGWFQTTRFFFCEKFWTMSYFSNNPKKRWIFERFWKMRQNMKCLGIQPPLSNHPVFSRALLHTYFKRERGRGGGSKSQTFHILPYFSKLFKNPTALSKISYFSQFFKSPRFRAHGRHRHYNFGEVRGRCLLFKKPKKRGIFEKFWKVQQHVKCLGIWTPF